MTRDLDEFFDAWANERAGIAPDELYHYTDERGFNGIVESGLVRARDYRTMQKDKREFRRADDVIRQVARSLRKQTGAARVVKSFLKTYDRLRLTELGGFRIFVACFSEVRDDPSQWRTFADGGRGFCLGLRLHGQLRHQEGLSVGIMKVVYSQTALRASLCAAFRKVLDREDGETDHTLRQALLRIAGVEAVGFKDSNFKREREWRILTWLRNENVGKVAVNRIGQARFVCLRPETARIEFAEIVLGPRQPKPQQEAIEAARRVLLDAGYPEDELPPIAVSTARL